MMNMLKVPTGRGGEGEGGGLKREQTGAASTCGHVW